MSLKLWQSVEKTDPKYTKEFSRAGGFRGTAINATYLIRKATELWGPLGGQWGFDIEDEKYLQVNAEAWLHVVRIRFRHPEGNFPAYGQTTLVGTNRNGVFVDEEAPKKSLTDAISKALSMLGFSADVHLGLFDDNKYVNEVKEHFASVSKPDVARQMHAADIKPMAGAGDNLPPDIREWLERKALEVGELLDNGHDSEAVQACAFITDNDEKIYLWSKLASKYRTKLKSLTKKEAA